MALRQQSQVQALLPDGPERQRVAASARGDGVARFAAAVTRGLTLVRVRSDCKLAAEVERFCELYASGAFPSLRHDAQRFTRWYMKRGSVLVYQGSLWHGGGANRTGERRVGIAMNYCAGWIRQQENQQLGIPLAVARTFSPRLRRLAGFGLYKRLIGHIDKCSPEDLLDGTGPRRVVGVP